MRQQEKLWYQDPERMRELERRWKSTRALFQEIIGSVGNSTELHERLNRAPGDSAERTLLGLYSSFQNRFANWDYAKGLVLNFLGEFKDDKIMHLWQANTYYINEAKVDASVKSAFKELTSDLWRLIHRDIYLPEVTPEPKKKLRKRKVK